MSHHFARISDGELDAVEFDQHGKADDGLNRVGAVGERERGVRQHNEDDVAELAAADALIGYAGRYFEDFIKPTKKFRPPTEKERGGLEALSARLKEIGDGAEEFAGEQRLDLVKPSYFHTEKRWRQYKDALKAEKAAASKKGSGLPHDLKYGTVGAVALDAEGNLAAGTSTGGMTLKRYGRVGDAPIMAPGLLRTTAPARCRRRAGANISSG
ncbi:MAG: hypothetical protein HC850_18005 [Rhodomicrobium sp.]|nr:hypothetical protein [Rhodomicrobium sp.]